MRKLQNLAQLVKTNKVQALNKKDQLMIKGGDCEIVITDLLGG